MVMKKYRVEELSNTTWFWRGEYNNHLEIAKAIGYSPAKMYSFINNDVRRGTWNRLPGTKFRIGKLGE